jgi:hypothetical protein
MVQANILMPLASSRCKVEWEGLAETISSVFERRPIEEDDPGVDAIHGSSSLVGQPCEVWIAVQERFGCRAATLQPFLDAMGALASRLDKAGDLAGRPPTSSFHELRLSHGASWSPKKEEGSSSDSYPIRIFRLVSGFPAAT